MTVQQAYEKIQQALVEKKTLLDDYGLTTRVRTFYTDKNLVEKSEFSAKCILVFGNIDIGTPQLEDDDWCNFSVCSEIKTGAVDDASFEDSLKEWSDEVDAFIEKLKGAPSPEKFVTETCRMQEAEAEKAATEFAQEMKKVRLKMILGLAVIIVLMLAVLILVPMID